MRNSSFATAGLRSAATACLAGLARAGRRVREARGGNAAVEFALMSPLLLGMLVPIADLGAYVYYNMQLQLAAQAGVEYVVRNPWNPTEVQNAIISAAPSLGLQLVDNTFVPPGNTDVLPIPFAIANVQFCGCASGTTITTVTCSNPPPDCPNTNPTLKAGVYYKVGAQVHYHTISGFQYPFLPDNQVLQAWAVARR